MLLCLLGLLLSVRTDSIWLDDLHNIEKYFGKRDTEIIGMEANNIINNRHLLRDYDSLACRKQYEYMKDSIVDWLKHDQMNYYKRQAKRTGKTLEECINEAAEWYFIKHSNDFTPLIISNLEAVSCR